MSTANATQSNKAARGTKRVCQACAVRFYDLLRDPILCPACGVVHTPVVQPLFEVGKRASPTGGKTGWRQSIKRPGPVAPVPDPEIPVLPEVAAGDEPEVATEEVAGAAPEDDIVLEQDADDADVSGLIEVDVEEPRER